MDGETAKRINDLVRATALACELMPPKEVPQWMSSSHREFFYSSPVEVVLRGQGAELLGWLTERAPRSGEGKHER
jgi:hypothetical protein